MPVSFCYTYVWNVKLNVHEGYRLVAHKFYTVQYSTFWWQTSQKWSAETWRCCWLIMTVIIWQFIIWQKSRHGCQSTAYLLTEYQGYQSPRDIEFENLWSQVNMLVHNLSIPLGHRHISHSQDMPFQPVSSFILSVLPTNTTDIT